MRERKEKDTIKLLKGQMEHYVYSLSCAVEELENYMIRHKNYNLNYIRSGLNVLKMRIELDSRMYLDIKEE